MEIKTEQQWILSYQVPFCEADSGIWTGLALWLYKEKYNKKKVS